MDVPYSSLMIDFQKEIKNIPVLFNWLEYSGTWDVEEGGGGACFICIWGQQTPLLTKFTYLFWGLAIILIDDNQNLRDRLT